MLRIIETGPGITVEPYDGHAPEGPTFGEAYPLAAHVEDVTASTRVSTGVGADVRTVAYTEPGRVPPLRSRVTIPGRDGGIVSEVKRFDDARYGELAHLEVHLS